MADAGSRKRTRAAAAVDQSERPARTVTVPSELAGVVKIVDDEAAPTGTIMMPAPRGKPASGRSWKSLQPKRYSSQVYDSIPVLKKSWEKKQEDRAHREKAKQVESELREQKRQRRDAERARLEERRRRRAEAELKASRFQQISDPSKIKKMNKKQLRQIRKTVVGKDGQLQVVSPWA